MFYPSEPQHVNEKMLRFSKIDCFAMFAMFICIIWQALSRYVTHFDGAGRIPIVLVIFSSILCCRDFMHFPVLLKRALSLWCIWTIFQLVNLYIQGSNYTIFNLPSDIYINLIEKFFFLYICIVLMKRHLYKTLICILAAFFVNISLYFIYSSWVTTIDSDRFLSTVVNGNEIAFECVSCVSITPLLLYYKKKLVLFLVAINVICVILIVIIASRTAFIAVVPVILSFFIVFLNYFRNNVLYVLVFCAIGLSVLPFFIRIFTHTELSQRFEERETNFIGIENVNNDLLKKVFGERALYIENGYAIFKEHPFFGVGYANYAEYFRYRNHVEYMAELSDGGIVGFSLFISFLGILLYPSFKILKKYYFSIETVLLYGLIFTFLLFNLGLFTTSLIPFYFFSSFILVLSTCILDSNSDKYLRKKEKNEGTSELVSRSF